MMIFETKNAKEKGKRKNTERQKSKMKKEEKATVQKAGLENPLVQKFGSRCRVFECASQYKKA